MKMLVDKKGRKHLVRGGKIHTDLGIVNVRGSVARSHLGHEFSVVKPNIVDIYEKMQRSGSFVLKKDIGLILAYTGVGSGDTVIDAGTGSGAIAIFMANIVKPSGKVYTYEVRKEFAEIAKKNIELAGLGKFVEVKVKDITEGIDERADVITLDMPQPGRIAKNAYRALRRGGSIAVYTPYVEDAKKTFRELERESFREVKTIETIERELEFGKKGTRPKTGRVGHTAYITFARKY